MGKGSMQEKDRRWVNAGETWDKEMGGGSMQVGDGRRINAG